MSESEIINVVDYDSQEIIQDTFSRFSEDDYEPEIKDDDDFVIQSELSSLTTENEEEFLKQDETAYYPFEQRINYEDLTKSQQKLLELHNLRRDHNALLRSHAHLYELYSRLLDVHIECFLKFYDSALEEDVLKKTCEEYKDKISYHEKDIKYIKDVSEKERERLTNNLDMKEKEIEELKEEARVNAETLALQTNELQRMKRLSDNVHCREADNLQTLDNLRQLVQTMRSEIDEKDVVIVEMKKEEARRCLKKKRKHKEAAVTFQGAVVKQHLSQADVKLESKAVDKLVNQGEVAGEDDDEKEATVVARPDQPDKHKTILSDTDLSDSDMSDSQASDPETYLAYLSDELRAIKRIERCFERKERKMSKTVKFLTGKLENTLYYVQVLENVIQDARNEATELKEKNKMQIIETNKKVVQIDELKNELKIAKVDIRNMQARVQRAEGLTNTQNMRILELEAEIRHHKAVNEKIVRSEELMRIKFYKGKMAHEAMSAKHDQLEIEYNATVKTLKLKESECIHLRYEIKRCTGQRDFLERQRQSITNQRLKSEQERDKIRSMYAEIELTITEIRGKANDDKTTIETLKKEKKVLNNAAGRSRKLVIEYKQLIKIKEYARQMLKTENMTLKTRLSKMELDIAKAEKERDRAYEETRNLNSQIDFLINENKRRKMVIAGYRKRTLELKSKLRESHVAYEDVRSAKRKSDVTLAGVVAQNTDIKRLLKISLHQVRQHKEEIAVREKVIVKNENMLFKTNCKVNELQVKIDTEVSTSLKLRTELKELTDNIKTLKMTLRENEATIKLQQQDINRAVTEKTEVATLASRRVTEIQLLRKKIDILENTLNNAGREYDSRLSDIKTLKLEIQRLREEKVALLSGFESANDVKSQLITKERELQLEVMKRVQLENEFQSAMYIHRRRIGGVDNVPDLMQKVEKLEKKVQTEVSKAKDYSEKLKESEILITSLKKTLSLQPGPEVHDELLKLRTFLGKRDKKIKCLEAELSMEESQRNYYKMEIEKLNKELQNLKKEYYKQKKIIQNKLNTKVDDNINRKENVEESEKLKLPPIYCDSRCSRISFP